MGGGFKMKEEGGRRRYEVIVCFMLCRISCLRAFVRHSLPPPSYLLLPTFLEVWTKNDKKPKILLDKQYYVIYNIVKEAILWMRR